MGPQGCTQNQQLTAYFQKSYPLPEGLPRERVASGRGEGRITQYLVSNFE
jgi:hypothetical protein